MVEKRRENVTIPGRNLIHHPQRLIHSLDGVKCTLLFPDDHHVVIQGGDSCVELDEK